MDKFKCKYIEVIGSEDGDKDNDPLLNIEIQKAINYLNAFTIPGIIGRQLKYDILDVVRHNPASSGYECFARIYYKKFK